MKKGFVKNLSFIDYNVYIYIYKKKVISIYS